MMIHFDCDGDGSDDAEDSEVSPLACATGLLPPERNAIICSTCFLCCLIYMDLFLLWAKPQHFFLLQSEFAWVKSRFSGELPSGSQT